MKNIRLILTTISSILLMVFIYSCSEDEPIAVDSTPQFNSIESDISSLPGLTLRFKAEISDPAGIKSVNLKYDPWFLDKTITKDSLPSVYVLDYKFKVPQDEVMNSVHSIVITAINAGDISTSMTVTVTLDQDVSAPVVTISSPASGSTFLLNNNGSEFTLDVNVSDNRELATLSIASTFLNETLTITGNNYQYTKEVDIMSTGSNQISITATDASGNSTSITAVVNILDELSFSQMFFTEVTDEASLTSDLFGIPTITTPSIEMGEEGYVFIGKYYSAQPGTEIRLIPQETSFSPYTFGGDPNNPGKLIFAESVDVAPIVLPEKAYYEIRFDVQNLTYVLSTYTPTDDPFEQVYILGRGVTVADGKTTCERNSDSTTQCWHFNSGKPFTQDADNPYRWTLLATLGDQPDDEGANGFILNSNPGGWAPFWRFDSSTNPRATVPGGGENFVYEESDFGDYQFIFDTHLNQIQIIRQ